VASSASTAEGPAKSRKIQSRKMAKNPGWDRDWDWDWDSKLVRLERGRGKKEKIRKIPENRGKV